MVTVLTNLVQWISKAIDRRHGDYNQFWHDRNYVQFADRVKATVVFTHGSQDWNVKPINVYQMFNALPDSLEKHYNSTGISLAGTGDCLLLPTDKNQQ